ncbi:MAG: ROK family protein [Cellulomonas sp.]
MARYLGLDIGGTNVKTAVVESGSHGSLDVIDTTSEPTHAERGPDSVVQRVARIGTERIAAVGAITGAAVTLPGTFDAVNGTAKVLPNLPGQWAGMAVRGPIARALGVPTSLINDARAFALAESVLGVARGLSTVVCVVLGTGVGGGVVIGGRLHLGHSGMAGEIAHQTVLPDGPVCGCGNRGCAESLIRAGVFCEMGGRATPEEVYAAAAAGDTRAQAAIDQVVKYLAIAMANAHMLLAPDAFVVGGGVAAAGDALLGPLTAEVRRRVTLDQPENVRVLSAQLGSSAGAVGAALWARSSRERAVVTAKTASIT